MAGGTSTGCGGVIKARGAPCAGNVAVITGVGGGNMRDRFSGGSDTIMAGRAGA